MSWFVRAVKKYAVFSGRSRRREYWYFVLFYTLIVLGFTVLDAVVGTLNYLGGFGLFTGIFTLALLLPSIAVTVRRLHDIDRTGWWYLISLVPIIGFIVMLVFTVTDSTPESNRYGSNPKTVVA